MKDTILWLQVPERVKPDGHSLYSSISDLSQWISRTENLKTGEQARLYFSLLIEVNRLDIPVPERLLFLEQFHSPVLRIISKLSKKYFGSGLPLGEEKAKYVDLVNEFWSEMANGYKIIIDDLSDVNFIKSFISNKDMSNAVFHVLYYLTHHVFYSYLLYTGCNNDVWRDIHQLYRFSETRNLTTKKIRNHMPDQLSADSLTIEEQYKKILLFSLSNPYHLSFNEMNILWDRLDCWAKYLQITLDTAKVLKKQTPFLIKSYSDLPPFLNQKNNSKNSIEDDIAFSAASMEFVWGMETKKLLKQITKNNQPVEISDYFLKRVQRTWSGNNFRDEQRNELIEPVLIVLGASSISQFLSQINTSSKILKLDDSEKQEINSIPSVFSSYQAFLMDESHNGFRVKLSNESEKPIIPKIGEIIAIKHFDDSIHTGYLRWLRENKEGEIECGIEHLSSMAEAVQISTTKHVEQTEPDDKSNQSNVLDSFVFPGTKENHYKPILFTDSFIEKFYDVHNDHLTLFHKTGSIDIKLTQKVDEVLEYSLYLFEKADAGALAEKLSTEQKKSKFKNIWKNI